MNHPEHVKDKKKKKYIKCECQDENQKENIVDRKYEKMGACEQ
jgi:hypothetical protein